MRGIIGMVSARECASHLPEALGRLAYRANDSRGTATLASGHVERPRGSPATSPLKGADADQPCYLAGVVTVE